MVDATSNRDAQPLELVALQTEVERLKADLRRKSHEIAQIVSQEQGFYAETVFRKDLLQEAVNRFVEVLDLYKLCDPLSDEYFEAQKQYDAALTSLRRLASLREG